MRYITTFLAFLLFSAVAFAQDPINLGDMVTGTLAADGRNDYTLPLTTKQTVRITVQTDAFDGYLEVFDSAGTLLASDDDSVGLNPVITFTAPANDTYTVAVTAIGGGSGVYTLSVGTVQALTPGTRIDDVMAGTTTYDLPLAANQCVAIQLASAAFDATITVLAPDGSTEAAYDDDSGNGTNSYVLACATAEGTYRLIADSIGGDPQGAFTLTVDNPTPLPFVRVLPNNDTVNVMEGAYEAVLEAGQDGDGFVVDLTAGQTIVVEARSDAFDTYVEIFNSDGSQSFAADDDGGEGTNSRLVFTAPADARYIVTITPLVSGSGGAFSVSAQTIPSPLAEDAAGTYSFFMDPATTPIRDRGTIGVGQSVQNEMTALQFESYSLTVEASTTVTITVVSDTFDPAVGILDDAGVELAFNDDREADFNSEIVYTFSDAGTYQILIESVLDEPGMYTITVQ